MKRMIYVVNWEPSSMGGFEWRWTREQAEAWMTAIQDDTAKVHEVELPDEIGDDPEGITSWLDSEGWSDGIDPRVPGGHDPIIESPSGWSFRESQENGDQVDCRYCGDPLNDNLPIENDSEGYAYHGECLIKQESEDN